MQVQVNVKALLLVAAAVVTVGTLSAGDFGTVSVAVAALAWGFVAIVDMGWPFFASRRSARHRSPQ